MSDDAELIALLLAGDGAVIAQVRRWVGAAIGRHRGRLGSEAEDLEQEVLIDLMEALAAGRFRGDSRLETYIQAYARHKCVDRLRALGRRDMVDLPEDSLALDALSPLEELTRQESADLARRVLQELPAQCQELWGMVAEGLSYRQMSQATGLREGAIRVRVHRCRQRALEIRRRLLAGGV
jgi:RNA polymerase sigma factor (sigma-70 family)